MPNIASHLVQRSEDSANKTAVIFGRQRLTFSQIHAQVFRIAAGLRHAGFAAGDKLGIMLVTSPDFILYEYAVFVLGGVVVPLNVHYKVNEMEHALGSGDVDFLVVQDAIFDRRSRDMLQRLPKLRRVFVSGVNAQPAEADSRVVSADSLLENVTPIAGVVDRAKDDTALMLHTSATTGKAKGVMLTVNNLHANYDRTPAWLGLTKDDCILCALPLYNTFGLNQCINAIMVTGASMVLLPRFDVVECMMAIHTHRCTFFPAVPTMLQKLLSDSKISEYDIASVQRVLVGGAPVPGPLLEQIYRTMGRDTVVMTGYGLTEATALVSLEHTALDADGSICRPKSVGHVLPGIEMIVADDSGTELAPNTVGQICIKGPNVMKGYYKQEAETAKAVIDGWLYTGDLGVMDRDRNFYIVDRKKDLIIRGGQNIYPADIEEVLYAHPAVAEAAVVGRPDEMFGEIPEAFVALKLGATVSIEELMALCKTELAYFKVPKNIYFLDELPKGPTGKILRRGLRGAGGHA